LSIQFKFIEIKEINLNNYFEKIYNSLWMKLEHEVLQGLVVGPLLIMLYTIDLKEMCKDQS
jgi:hypothetical protein